MNKLSIAIATLSLAMLFILSLTVSWQESTTMDEQAHIPAGYTYMRYLDMRLNPEHPPLLKDLAGIPLLFLDVDFPTDSEAWKTGNNEQWTLGNRFIHENDAHLITFLSRIPILLVAILLGVFLYIWTRQLAGPLAAAGATAIYALNPNVIAHSHYVTTDIGIAAAIFIATYYGIRWLRTPTKKNLIIFGLVLGIAQLVKFSAFLLYPFFGLVALIYALSVTNVADRLSQTLARAAKNLAKYWGGLFAAGIISLLPIGILYALNTWNMPMDRLLDLVNLQLADGGLSGFMKIFIIWLTGIPILSVFAEYFLGLAMVFARVAGGNTYYFLGEVSTTANAWYFPVVYVLKETLGVLFLLLGSAAVGTLIFFKHLSLRFQDGFSFAECRRLIAEGLRKHIGLAAMAIFVILYSYLSITGNLNIGFRHLFPILPFLYVFAVLGAAAIWKRTRNTGWRMLTGLGIGTIALWIIAVPFVHYPSYLSYYNELAGGPERGYQYVTDSNYDWGQDLRNLKVWTERYNNCNKQSSLYLEICNIYNRIQEPIDTIRIDYFGGSNPRYWFGNTFIPWTSTNAPEPGWYAISIGFLQENIHKEKQPGEPSYEWLAEFDPVDRAGDSIFIYHIPESALE